MGLKIYNSIPIKQGAVYTGRPKSSCADDTSCSQNINLFEQANKPQEYKKDSKLSDNKLLAGTAFAGILVTGLVFRNKAKPVAGCKEVIYSVNKKILEALKEEKFFNIKLFTGLENYEKNTLRNYLSCHDAEEFFTTLNGNKPACLLNNYGFMEKLKENSDFAEKFDILPLFRMGGNSQCYLVNKKCAIETINRNKYLYTFRMKLPPNTSAEEIYSKLAEGRNIFLNPTRSGKFSDITGITLGFPKLSSMTFQLEQLEDVSYELRTSPEKYKETLLKILQSEKSPYKNMAPAELQELEAAIKEYNGVIEEVENQYYPYICLANEPEEFARINKCISDFEQNFSVDNFI